MPTSHPWKRKVFIDTEFTSIDSPVLVSLALVAEDGEEFYAEVADIAAADCSEFVQAFVLPQLGQYPDRVMRTSEAASEVERWMSALKRLPEKPVICYDHPFDIDLLIRLIGRKPAGWQLQNISMRIDPRKRDQYFELHGGRHHALFDARANRSSFR